MPALGSVSTNHPSFRTVQGPGMQTLLTLANTRVGAAGNYSVSFRFRAQISGAIQGIRVYLQEGAPGYHGGNGGTIQFRVCRDNGQGRPNEAQTVALGTFRPNSSPSGSRAFFPEFEMFSYTDIVAGQVYHIVQTNVDPNPTANYISTNNCQVFKSIGHPCRWTSPHDWATLFRSGNGAWQDFTVNGDAQKYWAPIAEIRTNNGSFGQCTMEGGAVARRKNRPDGITLFQGRDIGGYQRVLALRDMIVEGFAIQYAAKEDNHELWTSVGKGSQNLGYATRIWTPWADYEEPEVGAYYVGKTHWRDVLWEKPVEVKRGEELRIYWQSSHDTAITACRTGASYGFTLWSNWLGFRRTTPTNYIPYNHNNHNAHGRDTAWPMVIYTR